MHDLNNLPLTENGGFAPVWFRWFCGVATLALAALWYFNIYVTSPVEIAVPAAILGSLCLLHHSIRAATHEAIRMADADDAVFTEVVAQIDRTARHTLTPGKLAASMSESMN